MGRANAVGEASAIAPPSARLFSSSVRQQATAGRRNGLSPRECRRRDFRNRAAFCKIAFRQCSPVSNSRRCGNSPRLPFKRRREDFCGTCALRSSLKIRQAAERAREKTVLQGGGSASQSEKHANHKTFVSVKGLWPFGLLSVTHQKTACAKEMAKAKALPLASARSSVCAIDLFVHRRKRRTKACAPGKARTCKICLQPVAARAQSYGAGQ